MAEKKPLTDDEKASDITKPDTGKPSSDSKPVIVTNRSVVADPMAAEADRSDEQETGTDAPAPAVSNKTKKIEPLSDLSDLKTEDDKNAEETAPAETAEPDENESSGEDQLKDISTDEQKLIDKKAAERQANLNKIAEAKTYYLPINQVVRRRSKHVAIAGTLLIILLGLAWLDVSLDAGLITIPGVKAPTHFFSK